MQKQLTLLFYLWIRSSKNRKKHVSMNQYNKSDLQNMITQKAGADRNIALRLNSRVLRHSSDRNGSSPSWKTTVKQPKTKYHCSRNLTIQVGNSLTVRMTGSTRTYAVSDKRASKNMFCRGRSQWTFISDKGVAVLIDMIDTAGTINSCAQAIKDAGALEVYACWPRRVSGQH